MKKKDIQDLKMRSKGELQKSVVEIHEQIRALRFDLAQGKVKNAKEIKELRKTVARIFTFLKTK